jgi:hypothetical protein
MFLLIKKGIESKIAHNGEVDPEENSPELYVRKSPFDIFLEKI